MLILSQWVLRLMRCPELVCHVFRVSTQTSMPLSQLPSVGTEGATLVMEFLSVLRRALTQQAPVKQALYRGICAVAAADADSAGRAAAAAVPAPAALRNHQGVPWNCGVDICPCRQPPCVGLGLVHAEERKHFTRTRASLRLQ